MNNTELILYQHGCGDYYIHQSCLDKWYNKEGYECIICREKILNEEDNYYQSSTEINNSTNIIEDEEISLNTHLNPRQNRQQTRQQNRQSQRRNNDSDDECCIDDETCVNCGKFGCFVCILGGLIFFLK